MADIGIEVTAGLQIVSGRGQPRGGPLKPDAAAARQDSVVGNRLPSKPCPGLSSSTGVPARPATGSPGTSPVPRQTRACWSMAGRSACAPRRRPEIHAGKQAFGPVHDRSRIGAAAPSPPAPARPFQPGCGAAAGAVQGRAPAPARARSGFAHGEYRGRGRAQGRGRTVRGGAVRGLKVQAVLDVEKHEQAFEIVVKSARRPRTCRNRFILAGAKTVTVSAALAAWSRRIAAHSLDQLDANGLDVIIGDLRQAKRAVPEKLGLQLPANLL